MAEKDKELTVQDINAQLALLQLKRLQAEEAQKADEVNQRKAIQKAGMDAAIAQMEKVAREQAGCSHRKEKGDTAVVGTRDSRGHTIFLCQKCAKDWNETTLPPHLQPNPRNVGGPIVGFVD